MCAAAHGPTVTVKDLPKRICSPERRRYLKARSTWLIIAVGDIAPGVFIIITTDQPKIIADMNYLKVNGNNNYWALYRPYHLCNLETPISIARALCCNGDITANTLRIPVAETHYHGQSAI